MRQSWAGRQGQSIYSTPNASIMMNVRKASMAESCRPPSRFMGETYSQIDSLISECDDTVPNLIGKIRETRRTKNNMIVPKGYKTKEMIGKPQADEWKHLVNRNQSIIKVLNQNKLHEEVEEIL